MREIVSMAIIAFFIVFVGGNIQTCSNNSNKKEKAREEIVQSNEPEATRFIEEKTNNVEAKSNDIGSESKGSVYTSTSLCEGSGDRSRFDGVEYKRNYVSRACESVYPRLDNHNRQADWELAVYQRCATLYQRTYNGPSMPTYKTACLAAENEFQKHFRRWNVTMKKRANSPVCNTSVTTGDNGEKEYTCAVWYSLMSHTNPLQELRSDTVLKP